MATTKKVPLLAYLTQKQKADLDKLSKVTRVPRTEYLREAVDMLLARYAKELKRTKTSARNKEA